MDVLKKFRAEGATRKDWYLDATVAVMCIVLAHLPFLVLFYILAKERPPDLLLSIVLIGGGAAVFLCIILRRHYPLLFLGLVVVLLVLQGILFDWPTISMIVVLLAIFNVARWMSPRAAQISLTVGLLVFLPGLVRIMPALLRTMPNMVERVPDLPSLTALTFAVTVFGIASGVAAYVVGRRGQEASLAQAIQIQAERDASRLQMAEQSARQRVLESQIRTNIARELHDIVTHSVAVIVVQAEGGLASHAFDKAEEALKNISESGREALNEMRGIVRMLRADSQEEESDLSSSPGVSSLPALISEAEATQTVIGAPHGLTPIIEMTIYRIVQEALANAAKHGATDSRPRVILNWQTDQLTIKVVNRLPSRRPDAVYGAGTGLISMAERVEALEGSLTTGPNGNGWFELIAQIPLPKEPPHGVKSTSP